MSFFTALTGLKGAQTEISTTSNNIANVGSNGFKKSRTDFGDLFGTTPLQTDIIGTGTQAKSIVQMHSQGNIVQSTNTLDMAISGQGFFAVESKGNPGQVVYTRNGSFNVDSDGYIVDNVGQSLLAYPVDSDGNISDHTLRGAQRLQLNADYGSPQFTKNISVGVNLDSTTPVIDPEIRFDANDPTSYSASSSITTFDSAGNPKSATVYYIKTQDLSAEDATYKYDTKVFVDGEELSPELTRATNSMGVPQFIDRFGQLTTDPADTGFILEGKGSPLYRADDLSAAVDSTPATLTGQNVASYLSDGQTVEIVTDPKLFYKTMEYQDLQNTSDADLVPGTFWGKDFLLIDVDESGPVSIDIPPGTYTGAELAAVVQTSIRDAFGDDRMIQLTDDVDEKFTIDLMTDAGDGTTEGLSRPLTIDLHSDSYIATEAEVKAGLVLDDFLTHAQLKINETLNARIQDDSNAYDVNTTQAGTNELNVSGRMFHKYTATVDSTPTVIPTANDIISFNHVNPQTSSSGTTRYLSYTYVDNTPEVAVYDHKLTATDADFTVDGNGYLQIVVSTSAELENLEVLRFQQNATDAKLEKFIGEVGTDEISIRTQVFDSDNNTTTITLNHVVVDTAILNVSDLGSPTTGTESAITILGKPSDHVEAYFENTQGLVEGVDKVHYADRLVMREIGNSAKRVLTGNSAVAFNTFASDNSVTLADYGLAENPATIDINWFDDRDPPIKIGYDETNQRFTFSADNSQLGTGTGVGFENFTVYAQELDLGVTNGLGMAAFGQSAEQSIKLGEKVVTESVLFDGPEVRTDNKRYGIQVEFDDVQNEFSFKSGTTGEALSADTVVGVDSIQNESTISVGRYALTTTTAVDSADKADYQYHRIGDGTNRILGIPRDTVEGYTAATGLVSEPAIVTGREALVDMSRAFTVSALGGENIVNVVVNGVSGSLVIPEGNYKGATLASELESRINAMKNPVSGESVGGVTVEYSADENNFIFTSGTTGERSTLAIEGAIKFGLSDVPLGLGSTSQVRQPVQATDEFGRPLYISPTGEITASNQDFADNMVQDYYPLYLDEGELTFDANGEIVSPITKIQYSGMLRPLTFDFSEMTQLDRPFEANKMTQDGYAAGRLTNLEIDNFGNVNAGYSNGQTAKIGKIIVANFANASGLKQIGNASFLATVASGDPEVGEASSDGYGQILSGSLERSNVDITEELVNLITSQRNYQASAKAIETASSMTQTIINIRS
jgi:flagellar hook protein FlgE